LLPHSFWPSSYSPWTWFVACCPHAEKQLTDHRCQTIVATAIPKITDQFHSLDEASWYGSAFFMTSGAFLSACN
jgi:hypothetical protein